jgi:hypothetical protein
MPKIRPVWIVYTCAWTDDVECAEFLSRDVKQAFQFRPDRNIGLLEHGSGLPWSLLRVLIQEFLGFRAEGQVCKEDITATFKEELCKAVIDPFVC